MKKIYEFQSTNYAFIVWARSSEAAWNLIQDYIASNESRFLDDEFVLDRRNYAVAEIELDEPKVLEDWEKIKTK